MHKMGISMGVVLAVENGAIRDEDRRQYLLVVRPIQDVLSEVATQYERIGAGYVSGKCLHEGSKTCNLV